LSYGGEPDLLPEDFWYIKLYVPDRHSSNIYSSISCVPTDYFLDFMYATYAKLAYKLMILVKHFCVLIFSIFRVFVTICHFSDVTINSFNSCVVAYFLNYISRLYRLTLRLLVNTQPHRSWEQCAISRQIERAYKNLGSLNFSLHDCFY